MSRQFVRWLWLVLACACGWACPASGQEKKSRRALQIEAETEGAVPGDSIAYRQFEFWNLNKIFYYYDYKKRKQIDRLERRGNFAEALDMLSEYVANFGIQNFYKETELLWRLGQLYERNGQPQEAKVLYRLVLKHHRTDVADVLLYYDSMTELERDYYIPLEYYYELVEYRKTIDTLRPPRGVLVNMGDEINSRFPDYAPSLDPEDGMLFFSSKRTRRNAISGVADEDIYISYREGDGWTPAEPFLELNTRFNEGSVTLSRDGKTLFFARCDCPDCYGNCDIFQADLLPTGKWGNVRNLGPNVNGSTWDSQPALSPTGDTLYFASDRLGGFGLSDIYYTVRDGRGNWRKAQNLGPIINTRSNEVSPFVHPEYNVLYFSSDGHLVNFGDFDIYKSYKKEGLWREPINIGPLVNGKGSEYYFTIDAHSKEIFYARSERSDLQNLDLYSFPLPMGAHPLATTRFRGTLTDSITGKPFAGIVSIVDVDQGIEIAPKALRPDGSFDFDLIRDNNYMLIIQGDEFFRIEELFYLRTDTVVTKKTENIRSKKIRFTSLEFEGGSAEILPEMEFDLDNMFNFLVDNPRFRLQISGHTDGVGNAESNLRLSRDRAEAIRLYLIASGDIDPGRITAEGYGNTRPLRNPERTEEDRRTNRRVEFEILAPE